jgi:hypothetical protein
MDNIYKEENKGSNITRNKTEDINMHANGTMITKYWNDIPYNGTVTSNTGKYYKIRYEYNDEEELNHREVRKYMDKYRGEGRTTREIGTRMRLRIPLGNWNILSNDSERMWPFYYSHDTDTLYRSYREEWHQNGEFYYDCHTITEHDTYNYATSENTKLLPDDAAPTDVMDTVILV